MGDRRIAVAMKSRERLGGWRWVLLGWRWSLNCLLLEVRRELHTTAEAQRWWGS